MSHIPNSVMPHAAASNEGARSGNDDEPGAAARMFGQVTDKVREYPKTAAAAGVVAAGIVAAAAIPAIRGRTRSESKDSRRRG